MNEAVATRWRNWSERSDTGAHSQWAHLYYVSCEGDLWKWRIQQSPLKQYGTTPKADPQKAIFKERDLAVAGAGIRGRPTTPAPTIPQIASA
jgi:hypothetical protein